MAVRRHPAGRSRPGRTGPAPRRSTGRSTGRCPTPWTNLDAGTTRAARVQEQRTDPALRVGGADPGHRQVDGRAPRPISCHLGRRALVARCVRTGMPGQLRDRRSLARTGDSRCSTEQTGDKRADRCERRPASRHLTPSERKCGSRSLPHDPVSGWEVVPFLPTEASARSGVEVEGDLFAGRVRLAGQHVAGPDLVRLDAQLVSIRTDPSTTFARQVPQTPPLQAKGASDRTASVASSTAFACSPSGNVDAVRPGSPSPRRRPRRPWTPRREQPAPRHRRGTARHARSRAERPAPAEDPERRRPSHTARRGTTRRQTSPAAVRRSSGRAARGRCGR